MNQNTAVHGNAVERESAAVANPVKDVMRHNYLAVGDGMTAGEVLDTVKRSSLGNDVASMIFVVGANGRHKGLLRLSSVVRADTDSPVGPLIESPDLYVTPDIDREQAARLLQRRDLPLLPVLDDNGRIAGVLRFDDAMDILEEEASEDVYWKAGIGDLAHRQDVVRSEKLTAGGIGYTVKVRMAFLLVTLVGGLMVGGVIDHFEGVLEAIVALAIFIPLVMDMGGNVGTQSTTIFARGLALGHIKLDRFFRTHLLRELRVGLVMGVVLATVGGLVAWAWQGAPNDIPLLGVVVGVSLMFSITVACILGFLLPYVLVKLGMDHAPGADPFITTIKDFSGLAVYFLTAAWLLGIG